MYEIDINERLSKSLKKIPKRDYVRIVEKNWTISKKILGQMGRKADFSAWV